MTRHEGLTRRGFLTRAAGAAAWPYVITGSALGNAEKAPANSRIAIGMIGVGGMGNHHLGWLVGGSKRAQVVAVCDVDRGHRDRTAARVPGGCGKYADFRELLARQDIDAAFVATPDHWHVLVGIEACKAGKDVYCEKPLTLTVAEGRALVKAVRRYGRVFQVGSQQRSDRRFRHACMLARNGRLGRLVKVQSGLPGGPAGGDGPDGPPPDGLNWDMWLGPAPKVPYNAARCHGSFRWFFDFSGGTMTDWGAHHNDIAQWGMGTSHTGPVHIDGRGTFPAEGLYETPTAFDVIYTYANGLQLHCSSSGPGGTKFVGTKGWVHVNRGWIKAEPASLLDEKFGADDEQLYTSLQHGDNWVAHKINWLDCIETRRRPIADVEIGHRTISMSHLGVASMRMGRPFRWDPDREQVIGDEAANRWVNRPMRPPWHL